MRAKKNLPMFLQLQQQSLLLGRKPAGFTEHFYTEWDDGLGKEKIALFFLISVSSTQVPSAEIAKEAFQLLQGHFLDDLSGDPYERFENALREINVMVAGKEKELEVKFLPNVQTVIGVVQGEHLYLSQRGDAYGYLLRRRHVSSITEGLFDEKNKEDLFQNIASGALEVGDNVLFVTGPLVHYVTPTDLAKIFSEQSLEEATRELEELLRSDVEDQMAMLSFEVLEKTEALRAPSAPSQKMRGEQEDLLDSQASPDAVAEEELSEASTVFNRIRAKERLSKAVLRLRAFSEKHESIQSFKGVRFLNTVRNWEKKKLLSAIVGLFVIGAFGLFLLNARLGEQRGLNEVKAKLLEAQNHLVQAQTEGVFDKANATILLEDAEILLNEILETKYLNGEAENVLAEILLEKDYLDNAIRVQSQDLTKLADVSSQMAPGTRLLAMEAHGDRLVLFSETQAFEVLAGQVQTPTEIDASEKVIVARTFPDYNAVVLLTFGGKLIEYSEGNSQFADTSDVNWLAGVDVATYSNKIYILDASGNQIWKYQRGNSRYGGAQAYLPEGEDLETAVSLAIDGKVWVLKSDGTLDQYLSGEKVDYLVKKAPITPIVGATRVLTELGMNQIYVLDSKGGRVFVYDKSAKNDDLTYSSQYVFDALKEPIMDIYIDKELNRLMLITASGLYEVNVRDE
jgi:hypothetical protein